MTGFVSILSNKKIKADMKTIYSIGRDPGCDIYLSDDKNLISRNHAILKVGKGGKYFIIDQSLNGTYINGIKVSQGVQIPVTRKDVISFAHAAELDWSQIPKSGRRSLFIILISVATVVALGVMGYSGYLFIKPDRGTIVNPLSLPITADEEEPSDSDTVTVRDVPVEQKTTPKPNKVVKKDSADDAEKKSEEETKDTVNYQPFV